jgi:two-component system response regulator QseB
MRLLLIEDDSMIGRAMQAGLRKAGFSVDWVLDGHAAELALANEDYSLAVLDLGLPKKGGMELLQAMRASGGTTPVLIATARDAVEDRIAGLDAGADDYVLKPFDLDELTARVRAVLRRHAGAVSPMLVDGDIALDSVHRVVTVQGRPVALSAREFAVLEALMQRRGAVLSRRRLEEAVYDWGDEIGSNAIEVHVHNLRKKLGPKRIENVRGLGYRVCGDTDVERP